MIKLEETVSVLYDSEIEFVLIGGAAMGVQGSAHLTCRVLSLEGLIRAKEAAARPRDLYVLPELRALAELKRKTGLE